MQKNNETTTKFRERERAKDLIETVKLCYVKYVDFPPVYFFVFTPGIIQEI